MRCHHVEICQIGVDGMAQSNQVQFDASTSIYLRPSDSGIYGPNHSAELHKVQREGAAHAPVNLGDASAHPYYHLLVLRHPRLACGVAVVPYVKITIDVLRTCKV